MQIKRSKAKARFSSARLYLSLLFDNASGATWLKISSAFSFYRHPIVERLKSKFFVMTDDWCEVINSLAKCDSCRPLPDLLTSPYRAHVLTHHPGSSEALVDCVILDINCYIYLYPITVYVTAHSVRKACKDLLMHKFDSTSNFSWD